MQRIQGQYQDGIEMKKLMFQRKPSKRTSVTELLGYPDTNDTVSGSRCLSRPNNHYRG